MVIKTVAILIAAMLAMATVMPGVLAEELAEQQWTRTFGGPFDYGSSVQQTSDGGYVVAGTKLSNVWLIKTDSNGNEVWNKEFGGSRHDVGSSVQQTSDGGFIVAGYTNSYGNGHQDVWLIRTDSSGNELWNRTFGGPGGDYGRFVEQTSDGGYIVVGVTSPPEPDDAVNVADVLLIKTDSDGNEVWTKLFDKSVYDDGVSVQQTSDGGYIVAGNTGDERGYEMFLTDVLLIRTDSSGNELWNRTITEGLTWDVATSMQQTSDGGCIITGMTVSYGNGEEIDQSVLLIKTDPDGNEAWNKALSRSRRDSGYFVEQTSDGGYIIAGNTGEPFDPDEEYDSDVLLIKTDSDGNEIWSMSLGGAGQQYGRCVQQTADYGCIIAGYSHTPFERNVGNVSGGDVVLLIKVGNTVEDSSGGGYWWVWVGAGIAVLALGAISILVKRRRKSIAVSRNR